VTERRLPRWSELRPYFAPAAPQLDRTARRLAAAATIDDLRTIARRRTPRAAFDYADGAAEREIGLRRSRAAFERVELVPRVLEDVSAIDTSTTIFGHRAELPLAFAPTGFTRLFHHEGEPAVARVAQRAGIPTGLSTVGTTTVEGFAAAAPQASKWFQVYVMYDRDATADLVARAQAAGFDGLYLTVDVPVAGSRLRDVHNELTFPPTFRALADFALHPAWWLNVLTTEPLRYASLPVQPNTVARVADAARGPAGDRRRDRRPRRGLPRLGHPARRRRRGRRGDGRPRLPGRARLLLRADGRRRGRRGARARHPARRDRAHDGAARCALRGRPHAGSRPAAPAGRVAPRGRRARRRRGPWRGACRSRRRAA
jgi:hypothetical protein